MPDNDDDGINIRLRLYDHAVSYRVRIGDTLYEFPEGTTREQAEAAIKEAKRLYFEKYVAKA